MEGDWDYAKGSGILFLPYGIEGLKLRQSLDIHAVDARHDLVFGITRVAVLE